MAFTADFEKFKFPESAFEGKRVLITGSGKDGGIGQALALAAAANGAKVIGDVQQVPDEQVKYSGGIRKRLVYFHDPEGNLLELCEYR